MICLECKALITETAWKYCPFCGNKLQDEDCMYSDKLMLHGEIPPNDIRNIDNYNISC